MIKRSFVPPEFLKNAFNCPHCNVYSNQIWGKLDAKIDNHYIRMPDFRVSRCIHCLGFCIWKDGAPIYPVTSQVPFPNPDLPEDVIVDFNEARAIINHSPRTATLILRVCLAGLCRHLGESGEDIDADIASLVGKGLNPKIQQNLELVRAVGPDRVTPGVIDNRDNFSTAIQLSQLINIIANALITQPKLLDDLNIKIANVKEQPSEKSAKWERKS